MSKIVLITGASSGIGLELAHVFARNGHALVLVARSEQKLNALANELRAAFGVQIWVCVKDLSQPDAALDVAKFCESNSISVETLVNNAGFGDFARFEDAEWSKLNEMMQLNMGALTQLTYCFLPSMLKNRHGRILNIASIAGFSPGPMMAVYFATKAFVLHFSEGLSAELKGTGVYVTVHCPGLTQSGFQAAADMETARLLKLGIMASSKEVAEHAYASMMKNKVVAVHGVSNKALVFTLRLFPRSLVRSVLSWVQGKSR